MFSTLFMVQHDCKVIELLVNGFGFFKMIKKYTVKEIEV